MRFIKYSGTFFLITSIFATHIPFAAAQDAATTPVPVNIDCAAVEATPEPESTPEATPEATELTGGDAVLHFESFLPTDVTFNPDPDKPVVVLIVFSLVFQNELNQSIDVRAPKFQLAIEGVPWGDVASTDFQMGQLLANATHGIVLQSLSFANKATDDQKQVLDCIRQGHPVDLTLTGTLDVYIDDVLQTVTVEMTTPDVIIQARQPRS